VNTERQSNFNDAERAQPLRKYRRPRRAQPRAAWCRKIGAVGGLAAAIVLASCGGVDLGSISGGSAAKICKDYAAVKAALDDEYSQPVAPPSNSTLRAIESKVRKIANEAPSDVKADLTTLADNAKEVATSNDNFSLDAAPAAHERVTAYVDITCNPGS
jgi:hypothetical protein